MIIGIGAIVMHAGLLPRVVAVAYDTQCSSTADCRVAFTLKEELTAPIFVYTHFTKFFVNHRNVMRSVSRKQIANQSVDKKELEQRCGPVLLNSDLSSAFSYNNEPLALSEVARPCGIFPSLFPRDDYRLYRKND